jgi:8-oxo-dGTP pyrophosphatase MutT (NUDIX family)
VTKERKLNQPGTHLHCPVIVLSKDGAVLTGHRHYTKEKWKDISVWTLPGGRSDKGETLEQTLRREVLEETGISDFTIRNFIGETSGAKEGDVLPIFFGTTNSEAKCMEPEKFSEWRWVSFSDYIENPQYAGFNPPARALIVKYLKQLVVTRD